MKNVTIFCIILVILCYSTLPVFGGLFFNRFANMGHHVPFQQSQHRQIIQQVQFPTVNYFVGAPIRLQALVRQELQADPIYQEFQQFKQFQALSASSAQTQQNQALPVSEPVFLVQKHCSKCHTGPSPKGEFSINGLFTAIERDKAARMVILNKMPKSATLSPAEKGDIIKEILLLGVEE